LGRGGGVGPESNGWSWRSTHNTRRGNGVQRVATGDWAQPMLRIRNPETRGGGKRGLGLRTTIPNKMRGGI